ncbi:hypothetical protein GCM10009716_42600 [Streptomyces sodiiphilus]|uniref:Uncharacterized protein n=1 Tax=Streptomyces sodiiphilus TaxID=226217 RepID=A0ABN2PTA3_9ACTN
MREHYYRLLYWKRRLLRGLPRLRPRGGVRGPLRRVPRPLLVFTLVVLAVLALSLALNTLPPPLAAAASGH